MTNKQRRGRASSKTYKIDLHLHTKGSFDSRAEPKEIVQEAIKAGLDGLVITDHHATMNRGSLEALELGRQAGLIVFLGCEYSSNQGHILVYGVDIDLLKLGMYADVTTVCERARDLGGIAVPAHPHSPRSKGSVRGKLDKLQGLGLITAFECPNGELERLGGGLNQSVRTEASTLSLGTTGGSDAHYASRVGTCYTEITGPLEYEWDLVAAIIEGRTKGVRHPAKKLEASFSDWKPGEYKPARQMSFKTERPRLQPIYGDRQDLEERARMEAQIRRSRLNEEDDDVQTMLGLFR